MKVLINALLAILLAITSLFSSFNGLVKGGSKVNITIDTSNLGETIPNLASNVNVWKMSTLFYDAQPNSENNIFDFVQYVQLMQCTGGTAERDLFVDPYDTSCLTDYDFSSLIKNCHGIISLGAKPHLKLGGVPLKLTSGYAMGGFEMNMYPPDDYNAYYDYIKAVVQALVDEFGIEEVLTWRFGCMTEYENGDWFMAKSGDPAESAEAFCKLYDYTVQALVDVLGNTVFVGAHSMTVTEGLWDEEIFIRHVASGKNYANGGTGTRICFLSASFYDMSPGEFTSGKTLPETVEYLKTTAQENGLSNLIYGIDEGRILVGNNSGGSDNQLVTRTVGYTWQAAYDARLWIQGINSGLDYFSSWGFLSNGLLAGYPTVSYHVANNLSDFAGSKQTEVKFNLKMVAYNSDVDCIGAWDEESSTLRVMVYNFKNDVNYDRAADVHFTVKIPQLDGKKVCITRRLVSDDCNFFDEWQQDRVAYGIGDDCFNWSPDDPCVENKTTLSDPAARELYYNSLRDHYVECSRLIPTESMAMVTNGELEINDTLGGSNVMFYEISAVD